MSRGMGRVERRIVVLLENCKDEMFSVDELCTWAFPGAFIEEAHRQSVRRALKSLKAKVGLYFIKAGQSHVRGWSYRVGWK